MALQQADEAQLSLTKERDVLLLRLADAAEVRSIETATAVAAAQAAGRRQTELAGASARAGSGRG